MNEELTLAVEEFRKMPPGRSWLIPVRFDDGPVPEWDLGAGRVLSDLNFADLYGADYGPQLVGLTTKIQSLMGQQVGPDSISAASLEDASPETRAAVLRDLTKELLPAPDRRIQLDEVVSQELTRAIRNMRELSQPSSNPLPTTETAWVDAIASRTREYWEVVKPFCYSLQVAAKWGAAEQLGPWAAGLRALANEANRAETGVIAMLRARHAAPVAAVMAAALASSASGRWDNFRVLLAEPRVQDPLNRNNTLPLLEATSPWQMPDDTFSMQALAFATATQSSDFNEAAATVLQAQRSRYHTPIAEWLHATLRPLFSAQFVSESDYDESFDRAEVMIGLTAQHLVGTGTFARPQWYGRSTWRARYELSVVDELRSELERSGNRWPPLQGGLFDGDADAAAIALSAYGKNFKDVMSRQN